MLRIHNGSPAILDPATGLTVVIFAPTAAGWSRAVALAVDLARGVA